MEKKEKLKFVKTKKRKQSMKNTTAAMKNLVVTQSVSMPTKTHIMHTWMATSEQINTF